MTDRRDKLRAVFLTALMIGSVFGAGVTLTGGAVADVTDEGETLEVDGGGENLSEALNDADDGDTIEVNDTAEYNPVTIDTPNVTVTASDDATINGSDSQTAVKITADGVTFEEFDVTGDDATKDGVALEGNLSDVTVSDNHLQGMASSGGDLPVTYAIHNWGGYLDNVTVENNVIEDIGNTEDADSSPQAISLGPFNGSETVVEDNDISDLQSEDDTEYGILLYDDADNLDYVDETDPGNVSVSGNDIGDASFDVYSYGNAAPNLNDETDTDAKVSSLYESNENFVNVSVDGQDWEDESGLPNVTDADLLDADEDGDIETVEVTMDEPVNDESLTASDFTIDGTAFDNASTGSNAYDDQFNLTLDDENAIDGTEKVNFDISLLDTETTDLAGNSVNPVDQSNVVDSAKPVVDEVTFEPSVINRSNFGAGTTVAIDFSESVNETDGDVEFDDSMGGDLTVEEVNGDVATAQTTLTPQSSTDAFLNLTITGAFEDESDQTNDQIDFSGDDAEEGQDIYQVDLVRPNLSSSTVTTIDSQETGTVDQLKVEFNDKIDDDSIQLDDFTVSGPSATLDSWYTGDTADDSTVYLNVSGMPADNTSVTPDLTVEANGLTDTAGNEGPAEEATQTADDGASPVVAELTVNDTNTDAAASSDLVLNDSDIATTVEVNATFTEALSEDPSVTIVGLEGDIDTGAADASDGALSVESDQIDVDLDSTDAYVNVSDGGDGSNDLVTFNESRITVDTQEPTVTVDDPIRDDLQNESIDITDNVSVSDAGGIDVIEVAVEDEEGTEYYGAFDSQDDLNNSLESFDTEQYVDGEVTVEVNATDEAGNTAGDEEGSFDVDNTAPDITINEPAETTAEPSGDSLPLNVSVDEPNIDGNNATITLENDSGGIIQYNASVDDGEDNEIDLRLNTSENASADGARLPNQSATNTTFDTQTVYDLTVSLEDATDSVGDATMEDALFLDDTSPANLGLFEPNDDDETEYELGDDQYDDRSDEIQIAYGYTEDNTDYVTVELTNESEGTVASTEVDESLYVDDGVIKSFELDLVDSFENTDDLADGQYNLSVTVTDLAGNENSTSTSEAPVYINDDEPPNAEPEFEEGPSATADLNETTEDVTVEVDYNITVPEVEDPGTIDDVEQASLTGVEVTSDSNLATLTVDYYDTSEGEYVTGEQATDNFTISDANATANASITETATIDLDEFNTSVTEDDRVLNRSVDVVGVARVNATSEYGSTENPDTVTGVDSTTLEAQDAVVPDIEQVEVDGPDTPSDSLTITFDRPVEPADGGDVTSDDVAYQDESGDQTNYVTSVDNVGETTVEVTLDEDVTADDVGSDVVDIQPDVLQNSHSDENVPAVDGTVDETDAPALDSADVGENASTVTVTFDQKVVSGDDGALTAENFTYTGDANVTSVDHDAETVSATLTLDADVSSGEVGEEDVEVDEGDVYDRFDNTEADEVSVTDSTAPSDIEIQHPTTETVVQSGDLLDVTYQYVENVPDNAESTEIKLVGDSQSYTYEVNDTQYVEDVSKTVTLDLDNADDELEDGAYEVEIEVEDGSGKTDTDTTDDAYVVIDDDAPDVENVELDDGSNVAPNVAPDASVNVSYDYDDATNATSVTVHLVDEGVENYSEGDYDNASVFSTIEKSVDNGSDEQTIEVDLAGHVVDNEDYGVFVDATDESSHTSNASNVDSVTLDVNENAPELTDVEAEAGSDTVTVVFSEDVVAADGDDGLTRADFAYQNGNSDGASAIEEVVSHTGDTVTLRLNDVVTAGDLDNDLINAAGDQINDTADGDHARTVNTDAVALADDTPPASPSVDAGAIDANNADDYDVTVDTTSEVTDVSVTLTGPSDTERSDSASEVQGDATFTFDASALEDGDVTVDVELTDAAGNNASATETVTKDTVAPTIEVAAANPGGSVDAGGKTQIVTVAFSEAVDSSTVSADAFTITSDQHSIDDIINDPFVTADNEVLLLLNQSVTPEAIDNSSVAQVEANSVTDGVGNSVTNAVNLTDEDTGTSAAPSYTPGFDTDEVSAEAGDENVTVTFDEVVEAGDGGDLTAANFTYTDANDANASAVDSVTQTGPQTVVVTLDAELTEGDLAYDEIGVTEDAVFDTSGNVMPGSSTPFNLEPGLSASAEGGAVTVQVTTLNDIKTAVGDGLTVEETNRELAELEGFTLEDRFTADVSADDFTEVEPGVYEASIDVPEDDEYTVSGLVDGSDSETTAVADKLEPRPQDAVILDVTSEAQLDDERNTTRIRVLFNEPIDGSEIMPSDVDIEGFDGEIVEVQDAGALGAVEIVVEGKVQTGQYPDVSIDGDSYTDLAGTQGQSGGDTVVHTDELHLEKGQNFVSVPAAAGELSLSKLDTSDVDAIYAYDAESESWDAYDPDAKENDFTTLEGGEGYIFAMDSDATLDVNVYNVAGADAGSDATAPAPNQQTLTEGWNLIGHYQEFDQEVPTALSSVDMTNVFELYAQSDSSTGYESYHAGDFDTLERGEAYWTFVTEDEVYTGASGEHVENPSQTTTASVAV